MKEEKKKIIQRGDANSYDDSVQKRYPSNAELLRPEMRRGAPFSQQLHEKII